MSTEQILITSVAFSTGLIVWCWARVLRVVRGAGALRLRTLTSIGSLFALSLSWLVLTLLIIAPVRAFVIRGHEPHLWPFMLGCGAALCGGALAVVALDAVRMPLGLSTGTLFLLWLAVLNG
jgi:hypothetical protein